MKGTLTQDDRSGRADVAKRILVSPWRVFCAAALLGGAGIVLGAWVAFGLPAWSPSVVLAVTAYGLAASLAAIGLKRGYPHRRLGLCNLVTLLRLITLGVLAVALLEGIAPNGAILGLAVLSLSLDGVDGWLARRQGLSSGFGARFDVEVDAGFALLLAIYAARVEVAGPYVILLGLPHYLFWGARHLWPWLNGALPDKLSRKAVCVLQISALILLLVPGLASGRFETALDLLILAVVAALIWSFGRDILWLYRSRA
jgi:phosphatidylglycerophosphate synthase